MSDAARLHRSERCSSLAAAQERPGGPRRLVFHGHSNLMDCTGARTAQPKTARHVPAEPRHTRIYWNASKQCWKNMAQKLRLTCHLARLEFILRALRVS